VDGQVRFAAGMVDSGGAITLIPTALSGVSITTCRDRALELSVSCALNRKYRRRAVRPRARFRPVWICDKG